MKQTLLLCHSKLVILSSRSEFSDGDAWDIDGNVLNRSSGDEICLGLDYTSLFHWGMGIVKDKVFSNNREYTNQQQENATSSSAQSLSV